MNATSWLPHSWREYTICAHSNLPNRYKTGSVSDVVLEDLLQKFTFKVDSIRRRNLSLTVETHDATKAKQLPGVELEISHGFDDAPEPDSAKTGKHYCTVGSPLDSTRLCILLVTRFC